MGTWNQGGFIDEYYDNVTSFGGATGVVVTGGFNTPSINFSLAMSGSLSGRVVRDSNGTGIPNVTISVYNGAWQYVRNGGTDSFGYYTVGGLPAGSYYVGTSNGSGYLDEYYDNVPKAGSSWPPAGVIAVGVSAGSDTPDINFGLALGGSISGRVVRDFDGAGVRNIQVRAYDGGWDFMGGDTTDSEGNYRISGLLAGTYYLRTSNNQGM